MGKKTEANSRDQYLKLGRPRDTCLLCSAALNVDGKHTTLIELAGKEEVVRKDFCLTCWARMQEQGYFSFWLTKRVNQPSAAERRLAKSERNEALWRLFTALYANAEGEDFASQLFLLAHLLMKYKVLMYAGNRGDRLVFQHPKLGESFEITDVAWEKIDFSEINRDIEQQAIAFAPSEDEAKDDADEGEDGEVVEL